MINYDETHFQVLENYAALRVEGHEEDWKQLMPLFDLQVGYIASVQLVLAQGTWRNADDPVRYIRSAARREQRNLDRPPWSRGVYSIAQLNLPCNEDGSLIEHDEIIDLLNRMSMDSDSIEQYANGRVQPKFLIPDSPHEDAECTVDYSKLMDEVAPLAGLSKPRRDWIEKVLVLRATVHISLAKILSCPDVEARKPLQAAWKWLDRNNALLAKVLSGRC
jgi:hypothetical protein